MYQTIVLGLGFLLLFGTAYLIKSTDDAGVIASTMTQTSGVVDVATSSVARKVEGTYLCGPESGCPNPSLLMIMEEGEVRMNTSYDNGVEMLQESGTWKDEKDGGMSVLLTGTDAGIYPAPRVFFVKYVSSSSLSGITFDVRTYKEWVRPVFRKQEREEV